MKRPVAGGRRSLMRGPFSPRAHERAGQRKAAIVELITPVVVSFAAILLTTLVLFMIDSYLATEHLVLFYLLPTIFIAIYFGSTIAVLTSFASGLAAAYFLLPPQFSFYIADRLHMVELGFTILLAVIASKVIGVLTCDLQEVEAPRADEVVE
jgi:K+-sensing histidine kinase KdpD